MFIYKIFWGGVSLNPKNVIEFAYNKIKKLYLLHIVTMLFCIDYVAERRIYKMICNVFLIQTWQLDETVLFSYNGVSWYLSLSLILYLLFPYLLYLIKRIESRYTVVIIIGVIIIQVVVAIVCANNTYYVWIYNQCPFYRMCEFIVGMLLGRLYIEGKTIKNWIADIVVVISIVAIGFAYELIIKNELPFFFNATNIMTPCIALSVYAISQKGNLSKVLLGNRLLVWLGDLSPVLYLIHNVVICKLSGCCYELWSYHLYRFVILAFSICVAIATLIMWNRRIIVSSK